MRIFRAVFLAVFSTWLFVPGVKGANGTWTSAAGGSWANSANWNGGIIASGSGSSAFFNTLALPSDVTLTLDGNRTITNLEFDDQNGTKHNWTLNLGSGGVLTLAGSPPIFTVSSATTRINVPLAGTAGFTKTGNGRLVLGATNTYTGTTFVDEGTLGLQHATFSATDTLVIVNANSVVESGGRLSLAVNTSATAIDISGAGALRLTSTNSSAIAPDLDFGPNHVNNTCYGARLATRLELGNSQRFVFGRTGHNGVGPYGLAGADCQFAGSISGSGGLTFIAQNNWTAAGPMEVPFALNAANTFTGPVEIQRGSVYLGNANALTQTNALRFNPASGNNARLFLYGNQAFVSDLSSSGAGAPLIANGNLKTGAMITLGAATLNVRQNTNTIFTGTITDVFAEYTGSGSGTTGPLNLVKNGLGRLTLSGESSYSGTTTIQSGVLQLDGSLGPTAVNVQNGGTLTGSGSIGGSVSVQAGGQLAPGNNGIGTLTVSDAVGLFGNVRIELSKNGAQLAADRVAGSSSLSYGGSLTVTNVGPDALSPGDSFTIFSATNYAGSFANIQLPPLAAGFAWYTSNLTANGSISVINTSGVPFIINQPQSLALNPGSTAAFNVSAVGPGTLAYQWRKNGTPIGGATGTTLSLPNVTTNDNGAYTVLVTNLYGSTTSSIASLSVVSSMVTTGLLVYLNFDNNLNGQAGTTNHGTLYTGGATLGPRYIPGVIGQAAAFDNSASAGQPNDWAVTLGNIDRFYSNSFTVSLWERTPMSADGALMGNKNWTSGANVGWVISSLDVKNLNYNAVSGTRRDVDLNPPFSDGQWHLITISFNRTNNQVISYVDGQPVATTDISPSANGSFSAGFATLIGGSGNGTYAATADIDDLAIWGRVLLPQEISGIYGAGLAGKPLTLAIPGQAPSIEAQPADINVSIGSTATLSVTASGPGPFFYQWRLNGTNLVGQTNATLVLASVTAANQGVYTVLVNNGSGAILSAGALLSVYELGVTGQWDFNASDLRATAGTDLEFIGGGSPAFTSFLINGQPAHALSFTANMSTPGYYMRHGAKPNGGGEFVNQYTLLMDVMFPAGPSVPIGLFQSDPLNRQGNDAEFFISESGLGAEGQFHGALTPGTWYRIAFVVNLAAPAGQQLCKYINGSLVGCQSLPGGIDGRYALGPTAFLFVTGVSGGTSRQGFANSIQFANGSLSSTDVAQLGGPSARGLPAGNAALEITSITENGSLLNLTWTGPDGLFELLKATNLNNQLWVQVGTFSNRSLSIPVTGPRSFYRVRQFQPDIRVGQLPFGEQSLPSKQIVRAAGQQIQFGGRPVDLALAPDGRTVFIKNINNLLVVDVASWRVLQTLNYPGGGASMHGIAVNPAGTRVFVSGAGNELYEWSIGTNQSVTFSRTIAMPGGSYPCGIAISSDNARAYVCLSIANKLAVVNLASGSVTQQINVGIAPWDVRLSLDGTQAYVSDWGGRFPTGGDLTASSAGTQVVIDSRGVASSGAVSFVNLTTGLQTALVATGLHPSDLELSADGNTLFVANANSDTVTVFNTQTRTVKETILVRPDASFPYGSAANGLALSKDGQDLFVATAGNNAIGMVELANAQHTNALVSGFVPTDWYPGAVVADSNHLYVVNVKGFGSREGQPANSFQIGAFLGTANKIPIPGLEALSKYTAQAYEGGRVAAVKATQQLPRPGQPPVPVPLRRGEPSVFQHVVYILKENKTYDQIFGDIPQGNGDPSLCIYPQFVSPNHHALAQQYVLLDNFYCNGVNSADGHSWSTEGNVTDHLEKAFGGFNRSYTFGDDPLTYSSTGFIWNNVLDHGLTFRNYGEMDYASTSPAATWSQIYADYTNGTGAIRYVQNIGIASLRPYSSTNVPGWNMGIPDVVRAAGFIKELNAAQSNGVWANFHFLYLPNDHTGGPPTPRAQVADNDLSLGMVVEAITKSIFASNTVIFAIEDDPQSGYDHVDAHRSICLVISPYTKRGQVISTFYNQAGVLHTMQRVLGLPAMNQQDAMAPLMFDCFTNVPNFTPYTALPSNINLAEGTGGTAALSPKERYWKKQLAKMDFTKPDRINDDLFNRYIWFTIKGDAPYPAKFVGGHGRGLKQLGLMLDKNAAEEDDDD